MASEPTSPSDNADADNVDGGADFGADADARAGENGDDNGEEDAAPPKKPEKPAGPVVGFNDFKIPAALRTALKAKGFEAPTDVQKAVLDPKLTTRDLLVSSRTGSGKTVAFGLAAAMTLVDGDGPLGPAKGRGAPRVLVIAPTRELAQQVESEISWLYAGWKARVTSCVGGTDAAKERRTLAAGVHVVVGTPGRLVDHTERKALDLTTVDVVILDEADEMLDMGFQEDLEYLLKACSNESRRTLLFSATLAPAIVNLARTYQKDAQRIQATPTTTAHQDIAIVMHPVAPREREHAVVNVLRFHEAQTALVFVAMRETVTRLHANLLERGFSAVALSGELSQAERNRALQSVRDGRARVLVCTDVAARGLDLPEVSLIIHGDVAENSTALTHRNGRTGRAGKKGTAVILATGGNRFMAERQLQNLGVKAHWTALPTPEQIAARDRARTLDRLEAEAAKEGDDVDDAAIVSLSAALVEKFNPQQLARMVAAGERSRLPAPEDVDDSVALAARAQLQQHPRGGPPFERKPPFRKGPPPPRRR